MITATQAIGAIGQPAATRAVATPAAAGAAQSDFGSALSDAARDVVASLRRAETASVAGIQGRMDTRQVVDAVMSAEHSLQTAIAVRDKVVTAWLDMSRMQI